jgi:hypothetical protein
MARVIQDNLKKPLANELLFGSLVDGGQVTVALDQAKNELTYDFQSARSTSRKRLTEFLRRSKNRAARFFYACKVKVKRPQRFRL